MATKIEDIDLSSLDLMAVASAQRERWEKQRADAQDKLDEAQGWLDKLDILQGIKKPTPEPATPSPEQFVASVSGAPRGPRATGGPAKVLAVIQAHPSGILSADIEKALKDQGEEIGSLGNILNTLKKKNLIKQSAPRQPYFPAPKPEGETSSEAA